ncbi:MAG: metal-dependent transcriptional regulator [Dehalococcoidia bacterium]
MTVFTSETSEDYLIAICTLTDEGEQPTLARLAAHCGVTAPTMGEAARRLDRDGLVKMAPRRNVQLTAAGREIADTLLRRHRLIERWLTDGLGLDWATAHEEAHRLEHAVSPVVEQRIAASMGFPETCPHGNPIRPLTDAERSLPLVALSDIPAGRTVYLHRISELAEDNPELMSFFESNGFRPGTPLRIIDRGPLHGPLVVDVNGHEVAVSPESARFLWVRDA